MKMKGSRSNLIRNIMGLAMLLVVLSALLGCSSAPPAASTQPAKKTSIGFVFHVTGVPFNTQMEEGATQAAKDFNVDLSVVGPRAFDNDQEIAMFQTLVQKGVDGIAVVALLGDTWPVPIKEATDKGISVVTANVDAPKSNRMAYYGEDSIAKGRQLADLVAQKMGGKGTLGLSICSEGVLPLDGRRSGVKAMLAEKYPAIKYIETAGSTEPAKAYEAWTSFISAHPEMTGAIEDCAGSLGPGKPSKDLGRKLVVGVFDFEPEVLDLIKQGYVYVTIGQEPYLQGYLPVMDMALKAQKGCPIDPKGVIMPARVVNAENVDQIIPIENDLTKKTEYYAKIIKDQYSQRCNK
jgi:simple sugar transport system substrate-binding protein